MIHFVALYFIYNHSSVSPVVVCIWIVCDWIPAPVPLLDVHTLEVCGLGAVFFVVKSIVFVLIKRNRCDGVLIRNWYSLHRILNMLCIKVF